MEQHLQLVFTNSFEIIESTEITTDIFDTDAEISGVFAIPLDQGQKITADTLFVQIDRIGGFLKGFIDIFLNGIRIDNFEWPSGRTEPIIFDQSIRGLLKTDGSNNVVSVKVRSQGFDGLNRWIVRADYTYNGNTEQPPTEPPVVEPPIIDDSQPGGPDEEEQEGIGIDIFGFLFGDFEKSVRTLAIGGGVIIGVVALTQVAKLAKTVKGR